MILVSERSYALCSSKSRTRTPRAGQVEVMFFQVSGVSYCLTVFSEGFEVPQQ